MDITIVLYGSGLTVEKLIAITRFGEKAELAPAALERNKVCRVMLEEAVSTVMPLAAQVLVLAVAPASSRNGATQIK